jgi:L-asparaginase/Glu-tRNA(Gln) amidotransferase subunit D
MLQALLDAGVLPGSDMTVEAALMKLSYVLSKDDWSLDKKREVRVNRVAPFKYCVCREYFKKRL